MKRGLRFGSGILPLIALVGCAEGGATSPVSSVSKAICASSAQAIQTLSAETADSHSDQAIDPYSDSRKVILDSTFTQQSAVASTSASLIAGTKLTVLLKDACNEGEISGAV